MFHSPPRPLLASQFSAKLLFSLLLRSHWSISPALSHQKAYKGSKFSASIINCFLKAVEFSLHSL